MKQMSWIFSSVVSMMLLNGCALAQASPAGLRPEMEMNGTADVEEIVGVDHALPSPMIPSGSSVSSSDNVIADLKEIEQGMERPVHPRMRPIQSSAKSINDSINANTNTEKIEVGVENTIQPDMKPVQNKGGVRKSGNANVKDSEQAMANPVITEPMQNSVDTSKNSNGDMVDFEQAMDNTMDSPMEMIQGSLNTSNDENANLEVIEQPMDDPVISIKPMQISVNTSNNGNINLETDEQVVENPIHPRMKPMQNSASFIDDENANMEESENDVEDMIAKHNHLTNILSHSGLFGKLFAQHSSPKENVDSPNENVLDDVETADIGGFQSRILGRQQSKVVDTASDKHAMNDMGNKDLNGFQSRSDANLKEENSSNEMPIDRSIEIDATHFDEDMDLSRSNQLENEILTLTTIPKQDVQEERDSGFISFLRSLFVF